MTERNFFGTEPGRSVDLTVPLSTQPQIMSGRPLLGDESEAQWLYTIGRLAPGVARDHASATLSLAWDQLVMARARSNRPLPKWPFALIDGAQGLNALREQFSVALRIVMAMVGVVLLVACANMARCTSRARLLAARKWIFAWRSVPAAAGS